VSGFLRGVIADARSSAATSGPVPAHDAERIDRGPVIRADDVLPYAERVVDTPSSLLGSIDTGLEKTMPIDDYVGLSQAAIGPPALSMATTTPDPVQAGSTVEKVATVVERHVETTIETSSDMTSENNMPHSEVHMVMANEPVSKPLRDVPAEAGPVVDAGRIAVFPDEGTPSSPLENGQQETEARVEASQPADEPMLSYTVALPAEAVAGDDLHLAPELATGRKRKTIVRHETAPRSADGDPVRCDVKGGDSPHQVAVSPLKMQEPDLSANYQSASDLLDLANISRKASHRPDQFVAGPDRILPNNPAREHEKQWNESQKTAARSKSPKFSRIVEGKSVMVPLTQTVKFDRSNGQAETGREPIPVPSEPSKPKLKPQHVVSTVADRRDGKALLQPRPNERVDIPVVPPPLQVISKGPDVRIGQVDVFIEAPKQQSANHPARHGSGGFSSRHYLRRL